MSIISPYDPSGSLTYATAIDWTCSRAIRLTTIYVTVDGSTPTLASSNGLSPVYVSKPWRTTQSSSGSRAPDPAVHSFTVKINSSLESNNQGFVWKFAFTSTGSPIVHAAAGATLGATAGSSQEWAQSSESDAIDQLTYGIEGGTGCVFDQVPGVYPGVSTQNTAVTITAPKTNGTYQVHLGFQQQFHCMPDTIGMGLGSTAVGTIIVP